MGGGPGGPPQGGGGPGGGNDGGYSTDEDGQSFDSDRRFSNYLMFLASFAMVIIFMIANVVQLKR